MSSTQQEKVKYTIEDSFELPPQEYKDVVLDVGVKYIDPDTKEEVESVWTKSGEDFLNVEFNSFRRICPTFVNKYFEVCNMPEHKDKTVSLLYKGFQFGQNKSFKGDKLTFWKRLKSQSGAGGGQGGGGGKGYPPAALEEVWFGDIEEANMILKANPNSKWYYVDKHVIQNERKDVMCYVLLKRNRAFSNP